MGVSLRTGEYAPTALPPEARGKLRDTFFLQLDFANVPVAFVPTLGNITIDADADFIITGGAQRVTTVADRTAVLADPIVLVSMKRSASGRDLQNLPVPISAVLGTAQRPARWEAPMLVRANSNLAVTVSSGHGAAVLVQMTFWGFKIFNV